MLTHTLGFPRIGLHRELKRAQEAFWKGELDEASLFEVARELRLRHWQLQQAAGVDLVPVGDFSLYDHVLDHAAMLGAVPERFGPPPPRVDTTLYFRMARGDHNAAAMEMTKWFDTNYHYIVPEFRPGMTFRLSTTRLFDELDEALAAGVRPKPVLLGPITFLHLGKSVEPTFDRWSLLAAVVAVYEQVLARLQARAEWIQIDEPVLALDLSPDILARFAPVYAKLKAAAGSARLLLATYFGGLGPHTDTVATLPVDAVHLDCVRAPDQVAALRGWLPERMWVSLGIVNGRNIWRVEADRALALIRRAADQIGAERLMLGTSCSLLHVPIDLDAETALDPELRSWMAFAKQKCAELRLLADAFEGRADPHALESNRAAWASRRASPRAVRSDVRTRLAAITPEMARRASPFSVRRRAQQQALRLPLLPTTTIGSFPQTAEIRAARARWRSGSLSEADYTAAMRGFVRDVIRRQEELDLDVLVHGEPERNDMVEYFGEQLDGFCFTRNGWVQSYGSRCVKPPVIYGDVARSRPMTVEWIRYAQSLSSRPVKGMLTGPVTILCWSFVRDDQPRADTCRQIALAIRDEVLDLERAGIRVIQIDEPAFREGAPLRTSDWPAYFEWAAEAFRLAAAGVRDETQIHTHMCYSEFNEILPWIAEMDADVISIEASRSRMELLAAFRRHGYPNDVGPGVYDIHSPRVPSEEEILELLRRALEVIPPERLWVNPDCGLKTREWPETTASLRNMVAAAKRLRRELQR
ncbi:MAG: 5-methyltetrahydropteroyltriglutamate--homocysteine S-methyltransferase [Kiritimatiellae bacterium]|nr:5-methyltetrahydropteroyltriglutamate--homocysteine S-methyltransferase [Kiritimatiellia bacterium]